SVRAYQLALPTLMPFYANDVVDFFQRVPSDRLAGRCLQAAYLRRHHPDLAAIRWQHTDMTLFERPWEPAGSLLRRGVRKGLRALRDELVIGRNGKVLYLGGDQPSRVAVRFEDSGTVLEQRAADSLVSDFIASPTASAGQAVDALLSLTVAWDP